MAQSDSDTETSGVERSPSYEDPGSLLEAWRGHYERILEAREDPDDNVVIEWDTTDDEAVLRLEEPPDDVCHIERPGPKREQRSICAHFDAAIDAAHESGRLIEEQNNPMGADERKHTALLTVPVASNMDRVGLGGEDGAA